MTRPVLNSFFVGNVLHDIRQGDSYRSKRAELEDLGITFYSHKTPRGRSLSSVVPEIAHTHIEYEIVSKGPGPDPPSEGQGEDPGLSEGLMHFNIEAVGRGAGMIDIREDGRGSKEGVRSEISPQHPPIQSTERIVDDENVHANVRVFNPLSEVLNHHHHLIQLTSEFNTQTNFVSGTSRCGSDISKDQTRIFSYEEGASNDRNISLYNSTGQIRTGSQSQNQSQSHLSSSEEEKEDIADCAMFLV